MKKFMYRMKKFFDLHIGPFFINGMRQDWYREQMEKKYGGDDKI